PAVGHVVALGLLALGGVDGLFHGVVEQDLSLRKLRRGDPPHLRDLFFLPRGQPNLLRPFRVGCPPPLHRELVSRLGRIGHGKRVTETRRNTPASSRSSRAKSEAGTDPD